MSDTDGPRARRSEQRVSGSGIREAVRAVSEQLRELDPNTPWAQIVGMRHILVHEYFGVGLDEVWAVVENDQPGLKTSVEGLLASLPKEL